MQLSQEFKDKYIKLLGSKEAKLFFTALTRKPQKAFRVNQLKYQANDHFSNQSQIKGLDHAYYGQIKDKDIFWTSGLCYSQDPSAMVPALAANVQPGEKVLDLCAAPGGKSTALAEALKGEGILVANEISHKRSLALKENLERWGVGNAVVTNTNSQHLAQTFPNYFDVIVVDAPCSGEGMFNKNEASLYWSQDYVLECQRRQQEILTAAVKMLKAGGRLVYSTCTFSPEEDEQIVEWLVKQFDFSIQPIRLFAYGKISQGRPSWGKSKNPDLHYTLRIWPQNGLGEGQFCAVLHKPNALIATSSKKKANKNKCRQKDRLNQDQLKLIRHALVPYKIPTLLQNWEKKVQVSQTHVFVPVLEPAMIANIRVLNNGLELGKLKKNRFELSQWLAQFLAQIKQEHVYQLDENQYQHYLHGETVSTALSSKGFILVAYQQLIFSWGKLSQNGILKNFYPKGLRK